jgi:hypothetical protein
MDTTFSPSSPKLSCGMLSRRTEKLVSSCVAASAWAWKRACVRVHGWLRVGLEPQFGQSISTLIGVLARAMEGGHVYAGTHERTYVQPCTWVVTSTPFTQMVVTWKEPSM